MAGNSAEFGEFLPVVRFSVENRTKIVPRGGGISQPRRRAPRGPLAGCKDSPRAGRGPAELATSPPTE